MSPPPALTEALPVPLVELRRATFSYGGPAVVADVDLDVPAGAMVGLVGPSGAGKTTLLRAVLGAIRPVSGEVRVGGRRVGRRPPARVGYVPQLETIDWHFPITVAEVVLLGRASDSGPWPWPRRQDREELERLLERLEIADLAGRHIRDLSGGQQQRVFLARALMRRAELLLLDEPTAGVDVATRQEILDLLAGLHRESITVVLATHDLNGVAATLPHLVCVNGRVVASGPPRAVLTPNVLRRTFGSQMVVFEHDGALITADVPPHAPDDRDEAGDRHVHEHHVHVHHGPGHEEETHRSVRSEAG